MKDLTGQRFGRLTVVEFAKVNADRPMWRCICDCGAEKIAAQGNLISGGTKSCGCYQREQTAAATSTHGHTRGAKRHPMYLVWRGMRSRCENPNVKSYANYGGRGITVCDRWRTGDGTRSGFECYLSDMGDKPSPSHSVERVRNDLPYSPKNCVWATKTAQAKNRRNVHRIEIDGQILTLKDACKARNISVGTVMSRLNYGWTLQDALARPARKHRPIKPRRRRQEDEIGVGK